ncbi:hypothetical protein RN001_008398 [Aquatica leii]|uniref:BESS domain-containing protein n=1 Tax=Aquatica leii TaxID=1421715 RepID=A0AAN7PZ43_9COLE|nr:hypothetical protein RN001_008398 [Aquatica leii]
MAATCEVDTELLIGAVQEERCIWDSSDERGNANNKFQQPTGRKETGCRTETNYDNNDDTLTGTAGEDSEDHSESEDAVNALLTAEIVSKVNERNFQRKKRRRNDDIDEKLISLLHDAKNEEDDDDRAFVTSLLPILKFFDEGQKLQFRAEVLRIMLEIKQIPQIDLGKLHKDLFIPPLLLLHQHRHLLVRIRTKHIIS